MTQLRHGEVSITGNYRDNNEDRFFVDPEHRYFLVADGMGGQSAGEKASALAVELVHEKLDQLITADEDNPERIIEAIDEAVAYANGEIMALGEVDPLYHNMGTTIAFLVSAGGKFYIGGVGDSRVYRLQDEQFEQITTDHSLTQALVDAGTISEEEAATHRYKNVLYRYLGAKEGGTGTNAREIVPRSGDRFVLCSDGVTDGIDDVTIASVVKSHDDPQAAAEALVAAAEQGGSRDNITCVVVFVD